MIPEMNLGQLSLLIRAKYLVDVVGYNQVNGMPLKAAELAEAITDLIATTTGEPHASAASTTAGTTAGTAGTVEKESVK
jgi:2-oxoglutarate ferredoxin oxidoreductase subunit alpha